MDAFRAGFVYVEDCYAGTLSETEDGYRFAYDADYLSSENPRAVSLNRAMSCKRARWIPL